MRRSVPVLALSLGLVGCGDKTQPSTRPTDPSPSVKPAAPPTATEHPPTATEHGATKDLGKVVIAAHEFSVLRLGDVVPGKEAAFEVGLVKGPTGSDLAKLNLYAWVEQEDGSQASAPAKGSVEKDHLHFHVTPRADAKGLKRVVLRLRADGGVDERAGLPLDGHGHEHGVTPHEGVVAAFRGADGTAAGHLELKLHDDKGDLELWLAKDVKITQPVDLPLDSVVRVEFTDVGNRVVELRARNKAKNEDEDGTGNVREGRTNYFIFPGETGADAQWLMGTKFSSVVRVRWGAAGAEFTSEEFMLVPHTHADGSGHK